MATEIISGEQDLNVSSGPPPRMTSAGTWREFFATAVDRDDTEWHIMLSVCRCSHSYDMFVPTWVDSAGDERCWSGQEEQIVCACVEEGRTRYGCD